MKRNYFLVSFALFITSLLWLAACEPSDEKSDPTPNRNRAATLEAITANATPTVRRIPSATPLPDIETELAVTTSRMERAIAAGDFDMYMGLVWKGDPLFLEEHSRWAEDWAANPPETFSISLSNIRVESESLATARMSILWRLSGESDRLSRRPGTTITVKFHKEGDTWLFGGEFWETVSLTQRGNEWDTSRPDEIPATDERIRVYYFEDRGPIPGSRVAAEAMLENLPGIYTLAAEALQFEPQQIIHIKLYGTDAELGAFTSINYPSEISVWEMPLQALKVIQIVDTQLPPTEGDLINNIAALMMIEMAENDADRLIWWLLEGVGEFLRGQNFMTVTQLNNTIEIVPLPSVEGSSNLLDWALLSQSETVPVLQQAVARAQSHALILFINETYGQERRNTWIKSILGSQSVDEASQTVFEKGFDALIQDFNAWLLQRAGV